MEKRRKVIPDQPLYNMPPEEVRLYDVSKSGLLDTPLDERGLVDLDALIARVKSTVDPEFTWASEFNDIHHLQWPAARYVSEFETAAEMWEFRELVNRKTYVPRAFHNWVHAITAPPHMPDTEVMRYSIDAQRVAMSLARTASLAVRLTRMMHIPAKRLNERLDEEFIHYNLYVENARLIPEDFTLLPVQEVEVRNPEEMLQINKRLGRLALDKIPIRMRPILQN